MSCPGLHCRGCGGHGSGGSALALIAAGVVIIGVIGTHARAIEHAVSDAVTFALIAAGSVLALALSGLVAALVIRARREVRSAERSQSPSNRASVIPAPERPERWSVSARVIAVTPERPESVSAYAPESAPERPESDAREVPAASASPRSPRW